ncbi:MAG: amino acid adenylation domain-containing protein, partial [Clostridiales bacterium]|nr:amino acid adenylation domain-containing protein [Clostridiales bacterium]
MYTSFLELFGRVAADNPNKIALCYGQERLRYAALDEKSNRLARALCGAGVGRGDIVPIFLPRGVDAIAAMLGVLKAGAAFCNINTDYPQERIDFIRRDTGAKLVLDAAFLEQLPTMPQAEPTGNPALADPAVVVYTSGSTGNPKGVLLPQSALALALGTDEYGQSPDDNFLLIASLSFIGGVIYALSPLAAGQTLHLAPEDVCKDARAILDYIRDHAITVAFFPPQLARVILAQGDGLLRVLLTGSEKVSGLYSEKTRIVNLYGASETCGPATFFELDKPYEQGAPIGRAYQGSSIILLDENDKPVPTGEEGEICICGQTATGYLNLPELTAERFIPNPSGDGVLYKTGDLGRLREDGVLEYVQRKDWMVKVRGFRVEPGEIEAAIAKYARVSQAVVTSFENAAGETALYGVYTAGLPVDPRQVEQAIRAFLPDYMIPAFLEQVESLPTNANGKIDRKAIRPPEAARFMAEYEPPQTETERALCEAFGKVLGLERVGALDSFSLLGGDSMAAIRLQSELPELGLSAVDILQNNTPRALAAAARTGEILEKASPRESWPLTFAERQMAAEQGMDPTSCAYNVNLALAIAGPLDVPRLECALAALVRRHAAFRSYYPMVDGEFVHKVADEGPAALQRESCAPDEVEKKIQEANLPYDLSQAPLFRFTLYQTGAENFALNLAMHHIIIDGMSGSVVLDELWRLYNGEELPPIELDYTDYALWQFQNTDTEKGKAFFAQMFSDGVPENEMPTLPKRPNNLPFADVDCEGLIDAGPVDATARRLGITPYALLLATAGLTLAKYCGSEDVVLGTAMNGRALAQTAPMVGMFVNTLPVRIKAPGGQKADEYARAVADALTRVQAHQTYPFEQIVPQLAPDRNSARGPVFDMAVNYLTDPPLPAVPALALSLLPIKRQALAMDIMLELLREGDKLRVVFSYSRELYYDEVIAGMLEQFTEILSRYTGGDLTAPLCDICELPQAQRRQILEDFAGERNDENLTKTVVDLIRAQAKRVPESQAVVFAGKSYTYAQMDDITDRIASYLRAGKHQAVGVLVRRSEMMPIGAIGVMKTGAAYLPLDPSYPAERLAFMLQDAGASVVIADEELTDHIPGYKGSFLLTKDIASLPQGEVPAGPKPSDTMVLLYTSGTTGKPKGVMLTHENLVSMCTWYIKHYEITQNDRASAYASFGFDAHMLDTYPVLISGGCLHIVPGELRLDLPGLNAYFDENGVRISCMTTQLGRQFAESMPNHSLRALSVGGEALVPFEPPKTFDFYNLYGPTECTVFVTYFRVDKRDYDRIPIGRAVGNTALYVVDKSGRLAPVGVAGELCAAGRQVAKGYLNRPDITEEKFVPNPFSDDPDYAKMYRTGDVARFLPDGNIDFVGRRDFQVKIRGFRVELTEIEERVRAFPTVTDAAVVAL